MWFPGGLAGAGSLLSTAMAAGLTVIVQTTVILAMGFFISAAIKRQGPVAQSFVLRVILVLLLVFPLLTLMISHDRAVTVPVPEIDIYRPAEISDGNRNENVSTSSINFLDVQYNYRVPIITEPDISLQPQQKSVSTDPVTPERQNTKDPIFNTQPDPYTIKPGLTRNTDPPVPPTYNLSYSESDGSISSHVLFGIYGGFLALWFLLSAYLAIKAIREYLFLKRFRRLAQPVSPEITAECHRIAALLGVSCPLIRQSPYLVSPIITGIRHPMIFLPTSFNGNSYHQTEIFLHELTHLKRHDQLWSYIRQFLVVCLPIQPLMWYFARHLDETADFICDAVVTLHTQDHRSYATTLFTIASRYHEPEKQIAHSIGFMSFASPLRRRIERILNGANDVSLRLSIRFISIVLLVCVATTAISDVIGFEKRDMSLLKRITTSAVIQDYLPRIDLSVNSTAEERIHEQNSKTGIQSAQPIESLTDAESSGHQSGVENHLQDAVAAELASAQLKNISRAEMSVAGNTENAEEQTGVVFIQSASPVKSQMNTDNENTDIVIDDKHLRIDINDADFADNGLNPEISPDVNPGGSPGSFDDGNSIENIMAARQGMAIPLVSETRIVVPVSRTVNVSVPDYQSGIYDLSDPDQARQYNIYASLDKNKNEPAWSPDGKWIVFTDQNRIWLVASTGGEPQLIFENFYEENDRRFPIGGIESISFMPDGRSLVFKLDRYDRSRGSSVTIRQKDGIATAYFEDPIPTIVRYDLKTAEVTMLADGGYNCAVNTDGNMLCYLAADLPDDDNDISVMHHPVLLDLLTGKSRNLNTNSDLIFGKPAFSASDDSVIIPCREGNGAVDLCRLSVFGGEPVRLTDYNTITGINKYIGYPVCSPDGNWVLYTDFTLVSDRPDRRLMLYSNVSGELFEMFPDAEDRRSYASWSPDGTSICYLATEPSGNALFICRFEPRLYKVTMPADVETPEEPLAFHLNEPFPNPFNNAVTLQFTIPEPGEVRIDIYSVTGQRVGELGRDHYEPGTHTLIWDGCDQSGRQLSSGVYIVRIFTGGHLETKKMTLAK